MCFSLGMTSNYICYCSTPQKCVATVVEFDKIKNDIHYEYVKGGSSNQYSHKLWCNIGHFSYETHFYSRFLHVEFVVDKVTLEHISYQALQYCHVTVIPTHTHTPYPFMLCFYNLSNTQRYITRTLTEGLRHGKDHSFVGSYL